MWSNQGKLTKTVWTDKSYYYDKKLTVPGFNHQKAQDLFNAIAKDTGKPVSFRIQGYSGQQPQLAEVIITLLGSYRNVTASAQLVPSGSFTALDPVRRLGPHPGSAAVQHLRARAAAQRLRVQQGPELQGRVRGSATGQADRRRQARDHARRPQKGLPRLRALQPRQGVPAEPGRRRSPTPSTSRARR